MIQKKKLDDPEKDKRLCEGCSQCCEYVNIVIETPKTKKEIDRIIWYLLHGLSLYIDKDNDWMIYLPIKCLALTKEKLCGIYDTRPIICREYSQLECEKYNIDSDELMFTNKKEFLEYINSKPKLKKIFNS